MNIDPQFPWWILADAAGGVLTLVVCAAFTPVIRHIVRRLTSVLPKTPDTERVQEELEGLVDEMSSEERIELAASLLLNITRLRDELAGQTAEIQLMEATLRRRRRRRRHHHHHRGMAEQVPYTSGPATKLMFLWGKPVPQSTK